ncbi:hypothetical protein [Rhodopirellula sp. P2]|uniref:hypothetical protein n=1 Tax=Rhodopirellula sp. P2 TaxID=2127060 RepID=UPI002367A9DE|nr:hypothetical protein [Rhodopirellula sp. P2]WDQ16528.1 hypothetical protein PSR62_23335 [Rhodopirellula sp. P2]
MFLQHQFHQRVQIDTERKLSELPRLIQEELGVPCTLDQAAMRIAKVDPSSAVVQVRAAEIPLQVALKRALAPLNLAAKLTSDGLVITADFTRLARAGIATDRWAEISADVAEQMESDLAQPVSIKTDNLPLDEAIESLQEHLHHSIEIDVHALEEEGLSADIPVRVHSKSASFQSTMSRMLRDQQLTLQFEQEAWVVTTIAMAEERPLHRIYYLEATGLTESISETMNLIQVTVDPESWEALGGTGTMASLPTGGTNRPGILVSTTLATHLRIEALLDALRAGTVGEDVPTQSVPYQDPLSSGSFHSGVYSGASAHVFVGNGNPNAPSQNAPAPPTNNGPPSTPPPTGGIF